MPVVVSEDELNIGGWQVMQTWERPLMNRLAAEVTVSRGDILEVGFGMGISAAAILACGCSSYTVIEAHPQVARMAREWADAQTSPCTVIEGFWQDVVPTMDSESFDGILFDTYPMSAEERSRNHYPFIPVAPRLLRTQGILTVYSDETVDFRPDHLAILLAHFNEVKLVKVEGLRPPETCEYWKNDTMVIPVARKIL